VITRLYFWAKDFLSRPSVSPSSRFLSLPLSGPAWVYGRAQAVRRWGYRGGIARAHRAGVPVISVGNITAGGTGKTPCVEAVCRVLLADGRRPAVLSRGYGGSLQEPWGIVSDGRRLMMNAREAGDEPVLLAKRLPSVPVLVGQDRRVTAQAAVERCGAQILVLDDGFQHLRLARDLDIVTVDARDPFGNGHCFPRGLLREQPRALGDAGLILLTQTSRLDGRRIQTVLTAIRRFNRRAPILNTFHSPVELVDLGSGEVWPLARLQGLKVLAFAGIGHPETFFQILDSAGARVLEAVPFPDHHTYVPPDLAKLRSWGRLMNVQALITTEKDAVRLEDEPPGDVPVLALRIELKIREGEAEFLRLIRRAVGRG